MMNEFSASIGIIGCGNMGSALVENLRKGFGHKDIFVFDKEQDKLNSLKRGFGVVSCSSVEELGMKSEVIVIAVKPQDIDAVLSLLKNFKGKLFISIAAGITLSYIESMLGSKAKIARAMPNLNALIGRSVTGLSFNGRVKEDEKAIAEKIFKSVGEVVFVKEEQMNAVTATSGSGPAFVAYLREFDDEVLNETIAAAAEELGLDHKTAVILAGATTRGTREILKVNFDPETLIKRVSSKGGTTEAGMKVLEAAGGKKEALKALKEAIKAACKRAGELARRS